MHSFIELFFYLNICSCWNNKYFWISNLKDAMNFFLLKSFQNNFFSHILLLRSFYKKNIDLEVNSSEVWLHFKKLWRQFLAKNSLYCSRLISFFCLSKTRLVFTRFKDKTRYLACHSLSIHRVWLKPPIKYFK